MQKFKLLSLYDVISHPKFKDFVNVTDDLHRQMKVFLNNLDVKISITDDGKIKYLDRAESEITTYIFNFAKTHWLINDIKKHGCGFLPQTFTTYDKTSDTFNLNCHPGTYRFYSLVYNEMYDVPVLCYDTHNFFKNIEPLSKDKVLQYVTDGVIRERKGLYEEIVIDRITKEERVEHHENDNNHDHIIQETYNELCKMYNDGVTVYVNHAVPTDVAMHLKHEYGFKIKKLHDIKNAPYFIPYYQNYNGVGIYLNYYDTQDIKKFFTVEMLYELDFIDDICYTNDRRMLFFNAGSMGCKRLSYGIVAESKSEYLNRFLWTKKSKKIKRQNEL